MFYIIVRLIFAGVFASVAVVMLRYGTRTQLCGLFRADGEKDELRLERALERREETEQLPAALISRTVGSVAIICAAIAVFASLQVISLAYAILCLVWAMLVGTAVLRIRRASGPRSAPLVVRDENGGIPAYVYTLTAAATVMPLAFLDKFFAASLIVTAAGVIAALTSRGVASMPAYLSGEDNEIESAVDDRLRTMRTAQLLALAVAPGFVFMSISLVDTPMRAAGVAVSFAALIATGAWVRRTSQLQTLKMKNS